MATDRLSVDARRKIEYFANATGTEPPPIPTLTFVERPLDDSVRSKIERHAGNIPVLQT